MGFEHGSKRGWSGAQFVGSVLCGSACCGMASCSRGDHGLHGGDSNNHNFYNHDDHSGPDNDAKNSKHPVSDTDDTSPDHNNAKNSKHPSGGGQSWRLLFPSRFTRHQKWPLLYMLTIERQGRSLQGQPSPLETGLGARIDKAVCALGERRSQPIASGTYVEEDEEEKGADASFQSKSWQTTKHGSRLVDRPSFRRGSSRRTCYWRNHATVAEPRY